MLSYADINVTLEAKHVEAEAVVHLLAEQDEMKKFTPYELILIRHGESDGNAAGLCQGFTPGYLTPKGVEQAKAVGAALFLNSAGDAPIMYNEIHCSDLKRVLQTCDIALNTGKCDQKVVSSVKYNPLLREKSAGIFEGRPRRMMAKERKLATDERIFRPRSGESWDDLQERVRQFITQIHLAPRDSSVLPWRILVFTSGGFIKEFINAYCIVKKQLESERINLLWKTERKYYPNIAANGSLYVFKTTKDAEVFQMCIENFKPPAYSDPSPDSDRKQDSDQSMQVV